MASGAGKYVVMWRRTVYICQLYDIRTYELALHRRKGAPMSVRDPSLLHKPYYIWVCRDEFFLCFFLLFLYLYKYQFWGFFKIKTYTWLKRKQLEKALLRHSRCQTRKFNFSTSEIFATFVQRTEAFHTQTHSAAVASLCFVKPTFSHVITTSSASSQKMFCWIPPTCSCLCAFMVITFVLRRTVAKLSCAGC